MANHQTDGNMAFVHGRTPEPEPIDTNPSDKQPPGVDEEWEPESLEEALLGEPAGDQSY